MFRRRRSSIGSFYLPCGRKKCPVKKDELLDLRSKEECPIKNDLLDPKSNEECSVENELLEFTSEELSRFTNQFSPENLIGLTNLGKLYRGKMPIASDLCKVTKDITVKILVEDERNYRGQMPTSDQGKVLVDDERDYGIHIHDGELPRLEDELKFLQAPKIRGNANLMKVVGYCRKEIVGVVYDINPLDTLHNMIFQAAYNVKYDIYAFGVFLYNLIIKRALDKEKYTAYEIDKWAVIEYKHKRSYVDESLEDDTYFDRRDGRKITEIARLYG